MTGLKIVVLKTSPQGNQRSGRAEGDQGDSRPFIAEGEARPKTDRDVSRWWVPFSCRKRSMISLNGELVGTRCGSRSCVDCHRWKLSRWVGVAQDLKQKPDEVLRSSVLTPDHRLTSHEDVAEWLKGVRAFLRQWTRSAGLGFGFWVAEAVPKWGEQSDNPCPLRTAPPAEFMAGCSPDLEETLNRAHQECKHGGHCRFCRGTGYLPAMHVHVHLLTSSLPFYYGDGPADPALAELYPARWTALDGSKTGFVGACKRHGMGVSKSEQIESYRGIQGYISKACLSYVSKGAKSKDIDWSTSAVNAALASWTFGNTRTRGAVGRAYGLSRRTKDTSTRPEFVSDAARLCHQLTASGDNHLAAVTEDRAKDETKSTREMGLLVDVLEVGLKAQQSEALINVLQKTQVYKGSTKTEVEFFRAGTAPQMLSVAGGEVVNHCRALGSNSALSSSWNGVPIVSDTTTWAAPQNPSDPLTGWYLGRGSSIISTDDPLHLLEAFKNSPERAFLALPPLAMPGQRASLLELIMKRIDNGLPWEAWRLSLGDLHSRASLSQEVFYDEKIGEMARTIGRNEPQAHHPANRGNQDKPYNVRAI